jgi:hypothetical protein
MATKVKVESGWVSNEDYKDGVIRLYVFVLVANALYSVLSLLYVHSWMQLSWMSAM